MASKVVKFRFLTATQVVRLHNMVIAGADPTQPALLESAVQSPISIKHYTNQQNLFQLAASLSEKIAKNHAFQDGNKRTALMAADMFLKINGYELQKSPLQQAAADDPMADALVAVCTNKWTAEQLGNFYQKMAKAVEECTPEIMVYKDGATEC